MKKLILISCICIIFSCTSDRDKLLLETSFKSIHNSNEFIQTNTKLLYLSLNNKANEIQTRIVARNLVERLKDLNDTTRSILKELDNFKSFKENSNRSIFLISKLKNYISYLEKLEPEIETIHIIGKDLIEIDFKNLEIFLKEKLPSKVKLNIEILKNLIYLIENEIVEYANNKSEPGCNLTYEKSRILISQNSLNFKKGEVLIISAGIGSYSVAASATFVIDSNSIIRPDESGVATFKKIVVQEPGKYEIPIQIKYINPDGERKVVEKIIQYEVH